MKTSNKISGKIEIEIAGIKYGGVVELSEMPHATKQPKYKAWGVRIDRKHSDPTDAVEYIGEAIGYTPAHGTNPGSWADNPIFAKIRPCLFKNGAVVGYLNPDNFAQLTSGKEIGNMRNYFDTMIEFGKMFYRIRQDEQYTYVEITDDVQSLADGFTDYAFSYKGTVRDKFYIGAYKGCDVGGKLRSISGEMPTGSKTIGEYRNAAHANGNGYEILPFNKLTLLQALYLLRYKSLDSRAALGKGLTEADDFERTGKTDQAGLYYGDQDGESRVKCHGIEDLWGNLLEWIDGFVSTDKIKIADGNFNDTGDGYDTAADLPESVCGGVITDVFGDNKLGFAPKATDDDLSTGEAYYCNYGAVYRSNRACVPYFGGSYGGGANAGAFQLYCDFSASFASPFIGARLCFCGGE